MKKQKAFILLLAMLGLMFSSCRGNSQQRNESQETVVSASEQTAEKTTYKGDLGQYALKGPVASITPENAPTVRFNREGQITEEDGSLKNGDENEIVKRNADGRIVRIDLLWHDGYETYEYNDRGLLVKYYYERFERKLTKVYEYNDEDELLHVVWTETGSPEENDGTTVFDYKILERDSHGNWTRRIGMYKTEEKRIITYYE